MVDKHGLRPVSIVEAHDVLTEVLPENDDAILSVEAATAILALHQRWEALKGQDIANRRISAAVGEAATTLARLKEEAEETYA